MFFSQIAFGDYVEHFKLLEDIMQRIYPGYTKIEKANIRRFVFHETLCNIVLLFRLIGVEIQARNI